MNELPKRYRANTGQNLDEWITGYSSMAIGSSLFGVITSQEPALGCGLAGSLLIIYALSPEPKRKIKPFLKYPFQLGISKAFPASHPLEWVDEVSITDKPGLERIISRTEKREELEWGTFIRAYCKSNSAIIDCIEDSSWAEERGLITKREGCRLEVNFSLADDLGMKGSHHYHPGEDYGSGFVININDRCVSPAGFINLLSFNLPSGAGLVAYNKRFTYIPADKGRNDLLVKADIRMIMKYLGSIA